MGRTTAHLANGSFREIQACNFNCPQLAVCSRSPLCVYGPLSGPLPTFAFDVTEFLLLRVPRSLAEGRFETVGRCLVAEIPIRTTQLDQAPPVARFRSVHPTSLALRSTSHLLHL